MPSPPEPAATANATATERAHRFDREHARRLRALAYRMLGSRADAEDVVQDAWLRWAEVDEATVQHAGAYLSTLVTRLCLDRLGAAVHRREQYVGVWLPEPLVDEAEHWCPGPEVQTEWAQEVSMAFLLALERLSPLERAAFLLHDVFDLGFDEVARQLDRSAAACRQLASRARVHVRQAQVRQELKREERERVTAAFAAALAQGDVDALARVLAADAVLLSDGGGLATAVLRPLEGGLRIAQALIGFRKGHDLAQLRVSPVDINGSPGWALWDAQGAPIQTLSLGFDDQGQVATVYVMRNPEKLRALSRR